MPSPLPLQGKTALVTGGSRGIGAGIAVDLAERGADVIIIHASPSSSLNVQKVIAGIISLSHNPAAFSQSCDLRSPSDITAAMSAITQWLHAHSKSTIDILVNNAGTELNKPLGSIIPEDFSYVYDLNVRGTILMTQAVLPYLPPRGRIINISSVGSRAGFANLGLYCSSKAALEGLTRCWAAELGGNGTTVNAVNPGPVQSEMLDNIPKEIVEAQKNGTPVEKRIGNTQEVAQVVGWLAGEESGWVTGQAISASGGWAMY